MNSFFRILKKYVLEDLLVAIGNVSRNLFNEKDPFINVPVELRVPTLTSLGTGVKVKEGNVSISAWGLLEIAYYAIANTHDFADSSPTFLDIVKICNEYTSFENSQSKEVYEHTDSSKRIFFDLFGIAQKEFWFQNPFSLLLQFSRDVEMLQVLPEQIGSDVDFNQVFKEITGYGIKDFRLILLIIVFMGLKSADLGVSNIDASLQKANPILTKENIYTVIRSLSAGYDTYRTSSLRQQCFYSKPIVHTSHGKYVLVNQFLAVKKFSDGVFWILRDHYARKDKTESRKFTDLFDRLFEKYVENLFVCYLHGDQYDRIPEGCEPRADWRIESCQYQIVLEQKSSLLSILLKDIHADIDRYDEFLERLKKGITQLIKTANAYSSAEKQTVKLLLLYDQLYMSENILKDLLVDYAKMDKEEAASFFIINIADFEHLVQILSKDEAAFNAIISEKLTLESTPSSKGKDFDQVIARHYSGNNLYVQEHLNHLAEYFEVYRVTRGSEKKR